MNNDTTTIETAGRQFLAHYPHVTMAWLHPYQANLVTTWLTEQMEREQVATIPALRDVLAARGELTPSTEALRVDATTIPEPLKRSNVHHVTDGADVAAAAEKLVADVKRKLEG